MIGGTAAGIGILRMTLQTQTLVSRKVVLEGSVILQGYHR